MSLYKDAPKILEVFKTDKGVAWGDMIRKPDGTVMIVNHLQITNLKII
jgi:hypothetical protein